MIVRKACVCVCVIVRKDRIHACVLLSFSVVSRFDMQKSRILHITLLLYHNFPLRHDGDNNDNNNNKNSGRNMDMDNLNPWVI